MTAVLHIGFPKTGSSYLRHWLGLNRDVLRAHGLNLVSSSSAHRLGIEGLVNRGDTPRDDIRAIAEASSLSDVIRELRTTPHTKVIASEYLSEIPPQLLSETFADMNVAVTGVVCYLRRQDHICASGYAQSVKSLGHSERVGTALYTDRLNWHLLYESWKAAFPTASMHIHSYEKCLAEGGILKSFKAALGVSHLETEDPAEYINLSLSAEMTEAARMLNERGQAFDPRCLLQMQNNQISIPFGFSRKTTLEFEELFIESNQKLASLMPDEFSLYAQPRWRSNGEDMTDRVSTDRLAEIMEEYRRLEYGSLIGSHADVNIQALTGSAQVSPSLVTLCSNRRMDVCQV